MNIFVLLLMKSYIKSLFLLKIAALTSQQLKYLPYYGDIDGLHNMKVKDFWHLLKNVPEDIKRQINPEMSVYDLWTSIEPHKETEIVEEKKDIEKKEIGVEEKAKVREAKEKEKEIVNLIDKNLKLAIDKILNLNYYVLSNNFLLKAHLFSKYQLEEVIEYKQILSNLNPRKEFDYKIRIINILKDLVSFNDSILDLIVSLIKKYKTFNEDLFVKFLESFKPLYFQQKFLFSEKAEEMKTEDELIKEKHLFLERYFDLLHVYVDSFDAFAEIQVDIPSRKVEKDLINSYIKKSDIFDPFVRHLSDKTKVIDSIKPLKEEEVFTYVPGSVSVAPELDPFENTKVDKKQEVTRASQEQRKIKKESVNYIYNKFLKAAEILADI